MELVRDYFLKVKLPIASLIVLFFVYKLLLFLITAFTNLAETPEINIPVLTGINLVFILSGWAVIGWAGIRVTKATRGTIFDGAVGGVIAAVVAGFVVRAIVLIFSIISIPVIASYSGSGIATGLFTIIVGLADIILGFFIDLVGGALFGGIGSIVHNRKIMEKYVRKMGNAATMQKEKLVAKEAKIVKRKKPGKKRTKK